MISRRSGCLLGPRITIGPNDGVKNAYVRCAGLGETYLKVGGQSRYLYRAVDKAGQTIDLQGLPEKINLHKSSANAAAIEGIRPDSGTDSSAEIGMRQSKYLNSPIAQDHRAVKPIVRPMLGLKTFRCARARLAGIETLHIIKNGQLEAVKDRASSAVNQPSERLRHRASLTPRPLLQQNPKLLFILVSVRSCRSRTVVGARPQRPRSAAQNHRDGAGVPFEEGICTRHVSPGNAEPAAVPPSSGGPSLSSSAPHLATSCVSTQGLRSYRPSINTLGRSGNSSASAPDADAGPLTTQMGPPRI